MFTYYMQFNVSFTVQAFWPIARWPVAKNKRAIGQKVAQFITKFRLTLNWTLLCLFDFMIIAQIIVRFIIDLTNTHAVNMLVMKNTA